MRYQHARSGGVKAKLESWQKSLQPPPKLDDSRLHARIASRRTFVMSSRFEHLPLRRSARRTAAQFLDPCDRRTRRPRHWSETRR